MTLVQLKIAVKLVERAGLAEMPKKLLDRLKLQRRNWGSYTMDFNRLLLPNQQALDRANMLINFAFALIYFWGVITCEERVLLQIPDKEDILVGFLLLVA
ncbi:hypothetical protein BCR34DRAFT_604387 [Clohesyomyces aquaticus]|uniref:Uncharacterized protein n=1 Tax=Clohesyomyces aquaticus TaxID=1231657 RepID=A0A1Y1Z6F7_9PLEO|nr:hypothetical protein BCR34DRAFT_604387 [Clohesyomyces aquaticus]